MKARNSKNSILFKESAMHLVIPLVAQINTAFGISFVKSYVIGIKNNFLGLIFSNTHYRIIDFISD